MMEDLAARSACIALLMAATPLMLGGCFDFHTAEECQYNGTCPLPQVPDAGEIVVVEAPTCKDRSGQCLAVPPGGWMNPLSVYIGADAQPPPCPANAPTGFDAYADLNAPGVCAPCQCGPSVGSCSLPATITAHAATCEDAGTATPSTPFDPPDGGWDGRCTINDAVDGGQLCDGGPCVQSLTIAPLTVNDDGCAPTQAPIPQEPPNWGLFARVCRGEPFGDCGSAGLVCSPVPAQGFRMCVLRDDDNDCPGSPYTEKHVFYMGLHDTRSCSPCSCDSPSGSVCKAEVTVYSDGACMSLPVVSVLADSNAPVCLDVIAGSTLGSKSASPPSYTPGSCQPSGGDSMGSADPVNRFTLCCMPPS
jgi:hypothetical protein